LVHRWGIASFSVSADGRRVTGLEDDGRIVSVADGLSGRVLCRLPRTTQGYRGVGLSEDGRLVATATAEVPGPVRVTVREVDTGRMILDRPDGPSGHWVDPFEFTPDGRSLLAVGVEGGLRHYALDTGGSWAIDADPRDQGHSRGSLILLPGGQWLAWGYRGDRTGARPLKILERATGAVRATFPGRPEAADYGYGLPDGRSLVVEVGSQAIRWRLEPAADPQPAGHSDEAWAVAFSPDGQILATGSDDTDDPHTLKLWDAATGQLLRGWKAHEATTGAVAFQPGGRVIASAALFPSANLRLWDAATGSGSRCSTAIPTWSAPSPSVRMADGSPPRGPTAPSGCGRWPHADASGH
jgi:hypothetical protein